MPLIKNETRVDLRDATETELRAIEEEAERTGLSFDDALKSLLRKHAQELRKQPRLSPVARLFGSREVH